MFHFNLNGNFCLVNRRETWTAMIFWLLFNSACHLLSQIYSLWVLFFKIFWCFIFFWQHLNQTVKKNKKKQSCLWILAIKSGSMLIIDVKHRSQAVIRVQLRSRRCLFHWGAPPVSADVSAFFFFVLSAEQRCKMWPKVKTWVTVKIKYLVKGKVSKIPQKLLNISPQNSDGGRVSAQDRPSQLSVWIRVKGRIQDFIC